MEAFYPGLIFFNVNVPKEVFKVPVGKKISKDLRKQNMTEIICLETCWLKSHHADLHAGGVYMSHTPHKHNASIKLKEVQVT